MTFALYMVRHGPAGTADPEQWPDDALRPLTERGRRRFARAARGLRTLVPPVDLVLSSGYTRARQTAEILMREAGWPPPHRCTALEPPVDPAAVLAAIVDAALDAALDRAAMRAVAVVGHEPSLHELVSYLLSGDPHTVSLLLKKGAVAALDWDDTPHAGTAELRWLLQPSALRALDR